MVRWPRTVLFLGFLLAGLWACRPGALPPAPTRASQVATFSWAGEETPTPAVVQAKQGDAVVLRFANNSRQKAEFHLHGYDLERKLEPGKTWEITFIVTTPGRFKIEIEEEEITIGWLEVLPR